MARTVAAWGLTALLTLAYLVAALGKLTGAALPMFEAWGYPPWFAYTVGVLELAGAVGLLVPKLTRAAILGLTGLMLGAAYTHLAADEGMQVLRPLVFIVALWLVWFLRGGKAAKAA